MPNSFPWWLHHWTLAPAVREGFSFFASLSTFVIVFFYCYYTLTLILVAVKWYLIVFICIFLMALGLLSICISSSGEMSIQVLCPFKIGMSVFSWRYRLTFSRKLGKSLGFLQMFFLSPLLWYHYYMYVSMFKSVPISLRLCSLFFISLSICSFDSISSIHLSSNLIILFFCQFKSTFEPLQ